MTIRNVLGKRLRLWSVLFLAAVLAVAAAACAGDTEKVVETVIVEKIVPGEKVVETVIVEKVIPGEKVVQTVVVVATAPPPKETTGPKTLVIAEAFVGPPAGIPGKQTGGGLEYTARAWGITEKIAQRATDLTFLPLLAESWKLADDQSKVTVTLRKGVQFHGGYGEMTASDVKWSYGNAGLENAESIHGSLGKITGHLEPLKVVSDYVVEIPISNFTSDWQRMAFNLVNIASKAYVDRVGEDAAIQKIIGTGPFQMTRWVSDNKVEVEAFSDYWGKAPMVDKVTVLQVAEPATRVAMIKTGEADIIGPVPNSFLASLKASGLVATNATKGGREQGIHFGGNYWQKTYHDSDKPVPKRPGFKPDDEHPWIGDPDDPARMESARKVRWALSMAIDRDLINKEILEGEGRPAYVPYFDTTITGYPKDRWVVPYDPDLAMQYLKEAGYGDGFVVNMYVPPDNSRIITEVYDAAATMWANIGLTPKIDRTAYQAYRPKLVARETEVLYAQINASPLDAFDQPRFSSAEASTWSENDWNPGVEIQELYDAMIKVNAAPNDYKARVAANMELGDFYLDTHVAMAMVHNSMLYIYNPARIAAWDLLPGEGGFLNSLNTIVLK